MTQEKLSQQIEAEIERHKVAIRRSFQDIEAVAGEAFESLSSADQLNGFNQLMADRINVFTGEIRSRANQIRGLCWVKKQLRKDGIQPQEAK